ncbi:MAG: 50S ribosomal protein L22 [Planctomycetota bacterium]|nr:50S ribosomal protein L22 [Planctomycetota bacterium]
MEGEFRAVWRFAKISATKARPVIDAIRGKNVNDARVILSNSPKRSAAMIRKVLESAVANAVYESQRKRLDIVPDKLCVVGAYVDTGPFIKRWRACARGRAHPYKRYHSHITVAVAQKEEGKGEKVEKAGVVRKEEKKK